jgi:hypothetical protein
MSHKDNQHERGVVMQSLKRFKGYIKNFIAILFTLLLLMILWFGCFSPNYIRVPEEAGQQMRARGAPGGGSGSMDKTAAPEEPASTTAPADTSGNGGLIAGALAAEGLAEQVESWLLPRAYADDHNLNERYLIRTGECYLQVSDYEKAAAGVEAVAHKYGGMISNSNRSRDYDNTFSGHITVRIPAEQFFDAWDELKALGDLREESVSTQDASRQYVAQHSRLKNLMAEREVLEDMLADAQEIQRTRGLKEGYDYLLKTQERLFEVSGEIASTEDQLNALVDRIVMSTITVRLKEIASSLGEQVEDTREEFRWDTGQTAGEAWRVLMRNTRGLVNGIVWFLITCWTWLIPLVIVLLILRAVIRRSIRRERLPSAGDAGDDDAMASDVDEDE